MKETILEAIKLLEKYAKEYEIEYDNTGDFYFEWQEVLEVIEKLRQLIGVAEPKGE